MRFPADNGGSGNDLLLRIGIIAMAFALVLTLVAVMLTMQLRGVPEQAVASEMETTVKSSALPLIRGESSVKPWREKARHVSASNDETNLGSLASEQKRKFAHAPTYKAASQSGPEAQPELGQRTTVGESDWTRPTPQEMEAANGPRHYDLPAGAIMSLTIGAMGIYGAPVFDSNSQWALANGVAHLPDTSLPWSPTPQRNVYLAGHRMGYRGTWSRMIFYNLDKLGKGDKIVLQDRTGRTYEYRVSDTFLVDPGDNWVTGQVRGRDMLTLQTCTPIPTWKKRLIVRADRL